MSSEYSPISSATRGSLHERESTRGGIEILLWGVEACEESWRSGMVKIIAGCVVAAALRVYGVWVSWEMNSEIRDEELRKQGEAWIDTEVETSSGRGGGGEGELKTASRMEETLSRSRSASSITQGSARRSNTLPATGVLPPRYTDQPRPRSQSSSYPPSGSSSNRPRLVLLPVYVDHQGNPIYSPTSPSYPYPQGSSPPAYSLPPPSRRSRSKTSTSSSSSSSASRSPSRSKHLSSPPPPPPPKSSSSFRTRSYSSSSSSSTSSAPLTSSPNKFTTLSLPPHYTDEPISLSPPTTPTATSSSLLKSQEGGQRSRRSRNRSDTDALLVSLPEITV